MSKTMDGLQVAFAGESQANRKYTLFAQKAIDEGYPQAARMFKAAAEAEAVHAANHLRAMKKTQSTADNLKAAIEGEIYEFKQMYPPFIAAAKAEGEKEALRSFEYANTVEETHAELYTKILNNLSKGMEEYPYYVCPVCGHTTEKSFPGKCPVCNAQGSLAKKID